MAGRPKVYTIPPGVPFLAALAERLQLEAGGNQGLAAALVLLPTRRACRALAETFLRLNDGRAMILPRLRPIGDVDEPGLDLAADEPVNGAALDLPPAIPELRRRLLLARLIRAHAGARGSEIDAAQAADLARALGTLIDAVVTERQSFDRLATLVPDDYAAHWQITLDFLRIVTEHWPKVLEEEGCIDAVDRRNRLIEAQRDAWRASPPLTLVVAAGSTGSIPATADLLATVADLPAGAVILPGLDQTIDESSRELYGPTHPQFGMLRLLNRFGMAAAEVADWTSAPRASPRFRLAAAALRPSGLTVPVAVNYAPSDLDSVLRIDCPGPQEEAGVIALLLRQAIETRQKTAALVTPDRVLARRVVAELGRWDIAIDDSAGLPLAETPPGLFLRLIAAASAAEAAPAALLALLKHPLAAGGMAPSRFRAFARRLEIAALRGPKPEAGFDGLIGALKPEQRGSELGDWLRQLADIAAPFFAAVAQPRSDVGLLLDAHLAAAEALAATDATAGGAVLWQGEAGEAAADFVHDFGEAAHDFAAIRGTEYAALFDALIAAKTVRPRYGLHPRLHIWGLLEARLVHADLVILGGLNEGTWPPDPGADPWMSRPMRARFGLPALERRIGLAAHDFVQAFCADEVAITRSTRVDGTPTVPSRWLQRIEALMPAAWPSAAASHWLGLQAALDMPGRAEIKAMAPPEPRPMVSARPRRLSVTQIETWMRDPYAIFARHVLRLKPLPPIEEDPSAATRGIILHQAFDRFLRKTQDALPGDALALLIECGRQAFAAAGTPPSVTAFWWPRFERAARWFIAAERERRTDLAAIRSEVKGGVEIAAPAGAFWLNATADRVDTRRDGSISIVDFKSGGVPQDNEIALGFAPQLALEGVIATEGGFKDVAAGRIAELAFWRVSGGREPGEIKATPGDPQTLVRAARAGLAALIAAFDRIETPYLSVPNARFAPRYSDYGHLARIAEWSVAGGDGGGEE